MAVLVVAAHDGKTVRANVANAVAAAAQMDPEVHVLVAGSNAGEAAQSAAAIQGVAKVLQAEDAAYANWLAEDIAPLVVKLAPGYSHVVMAADSVGKNVAPRAAALLDVAQVSEAIQVVSPDTFVRPIYAGNAMATVQSTDKIKIVTVRPTNFKAAAGGGSAAIEQIAGTGSAGLSSFAGAELSKSERPELTSAKIVVSGGRGLQSGENFKMLETLADKLGAG
ncbi:MAG: electron transfer flavoprotein subunit alpha/FixB family protein, partial [Reyranella sp.]